MSDLEYLSFAEIIVDAMYELVNVDLKSKVYLCNNHLWYIVE